jgi:hypothetical protein
MAKIRDYAACIYLEGKCVANIMIKAESYEEAELAAITGLYVEVYDRDRVADEEEDE